MRHASENGIDYGEFLLELTTTELHTRTENRLNRRLHESKFPMINPLETFDLGAVTELDLRLFHELVPEDFIC
ncbi:MAG: hypothetical protein CVU65_18600 [Deltaproteobacteria bacterium HGW-Deltaproteobacteria-22]|nr:MAG: hypothetical protein CVU65_18600 [Deltaproteobacteria bacterium HGW-Deltaproteobacteria-22]